MMLMFFIGCCF